jgi:hypothetical protein
MPASAQPTADQVTNETRQSLLLPAGLATAIAPLLAYNLPPSPTLLNQCLAVALWGGFVLVAAPVGGARDVRPLLPLWLALAALAAGVLQSLLFGSLPSALALSALGLLAAAAVLAWAGAAATRDAPTTTFAAFAWGLLAAGALSAGVALVQVFAPGWTDGDLIAHSGLAGRAVGNLRQPNQLCSLLLWAVVAAVALHELRRLAWWATVAGVVLLVFAVELSASRTGAAALLLLAMWGALDRRLTRPARRLLLATPLIYAASYALMAGWGELTSQAVGAEARLAAGAGGIEGPNTRSRIWSNAIALIAQQPWSGVGYGEFNLAWTLTPFPDRPTAFFDHTHTLPLQLLVELGLPLGGLVLALLGWALWQAWRGARHAGVAARAALMLVLVIGLHSMVEYPLWYSYFLLPAAWAWGHALGSQAGGDGAAPPRTRRAARAGMAAGLVLLAGGVLALLDYQRVVVIFAPGAGAGPLAERIRQGQRSLFFAHHADYAAATSPEPGVDRDLAFQRAPHYLLDTRLMVAWARELEARGDTDLARTLAARLREFRNREADDYFQPCGQADAASAIPCQAPAAAHGWREFVAPRAPDQPCRPRQGFACPGP